MSFHEGLGSDMITGRARTPRDPYTVLSDTQKQNIHKDPGAFFMFSKPERPYPDKGWYLDRYATNTNQHHLRGPPMTHPYCWIDTQWQRGPAEQYNTARLGGAERWGPDKVGSRTIQHFNQAEDSKRFTKPEVYRRPTTNIPGQIGMDYGRPSVGYYAPRNPSSTTWFGSTVPLNRTSVLEDIRPKTMAEYEQKWQTQRAEVAARKHQFPAYSEYTDRVFLRTKVEPSMVPGPFTPEIYIRLKNRKRYLEEAAA